MTTTRELAWIASEIHCVPLSTDICSQSHMQPHSCKTSRKDSRIGVVGALLAMDVMQKTPGWISSSKLMSPLSCCGQVNVVVMRFNILAALEYTSINFESTRVEKDICISALLPRMNLLGLSKVLSNAVDSQPAGADTFQCLFP
jgi:hypothetical protein